LNTKIIKSAIKRKAEQQDKLLINTIVASIQDKKGEQITCLDLRKINEAMADYFIFCTASNNILLKTIADNIEKKVWEQLAEKPHRVEGTRGQQWIIVDYVNVVIHCMMPETRDYYQLEELWLDANKIEF
jgi:ribosome-associated protein